MDNPITRILWAVSVQDSSFSTALREITDIEPRFPTDQLTAVLIDLKTDDISYDAAVQQLTEMVPGAMQSADRNLMRRVPPGHLCEKCASDQSKVVDSRRDNRVFYRRRECKECGHRWRTREIPY